MQVLKLDFMPHYKELPTKNHINEKQRIEAKDYVLKKSLDPSITKMNSSLYCTCKEPLFPHLLSCDHCNKQYKMCIVSGNAVIDETKCSSCQNSANKGDWNTFIKYKQHCPKCKTTETFK